MNGEFRNTIQVIGSRIWNVTKITQMISLNHMEQLRVTDWNGLVLLYNGHFLLSNMRKTEQSRI